MNPIPLFLEIGEKRTFAGAVDWFGWYGQGRDEQSVIESFLRNGSRCTLFVFDAMYRWLTLETTVRLLDGPNVRDLSLPLFRQMQNRPTGNLNWFGKELSPEEFLQTMAQEKRLIYEFDVIRGYGMV